MDAISPEVFLWFCSTQHRASHRNAHLIVLTHEHSFPKPQHPNRREDPVAIANKDIEIRVLGLVFVLGQTHQLFRGCSLIRDCASFKHHRSAPTPIPTSKTAHHKIRTPKTMSSVIVCLLQAVVVFSAVNHPALALVPQHGIISRAPFPSRQQCRRAQTPITSSSLHMRFDRNDGVGQSDRGWFHKRKENVVRLWSRLRKDKPSTDTVTSATVTGTSRMTSPTRKGRTSRMMIVSAASMLLSWFARPMMAFAMGGGMSRSGPVAPMKRNDLISLSGLFFGMFTVLALLHACEIAVTTLYPWKVREFAEEEEKAGKRGTFQVLNEDITRVLTTILVTSTACSIFATTIFTHLVAAMFGMKGERYGALALTGLTLFFVELLPKSIGVTNAEAVARLIIPVVNIISAIVSPVGITLSWLAKKTLTLIGLKNNGSEGGISDSQLRLIVTGARDSGTIDTGEQEMIQGVLGLQNQRVREIMKPRVEVVAVPSTMSVASVLGVVRESGYSRIPVYDGEIDNIVGIVLAKSVLDFFVRGVLVDDEDVIKKLSKGDHSSSQDNGDDTGSNGDNDGKSENETATTTEASKFYATTSGTIDQGSQGQQFVRSLTGQELASRMDTSIKEAGIIESCYFVPETANGWSVLQEMRRRRVHMAVVVDEFGGTEGLVSLEDIVEEVVGEIYDEDDEEDFEFSEDSITLQEDGSFLIRGDADLADCDAILSLRLEEEEAYKEFSTLSGFLCYCSGEIPNVGDFVMSRGWCFEIRNADDKKILQVKVERLVGAFGDDVDENEDEDEDGSDAAAGDDAGDNPLRNFLKRNLGEEDGDDPQENDDSGEASDSKVDDELRKTRNTNRDTAREVESMIASQKRKMAILDDTKSDIVKESEDSG